MPDGLGQIKNFKREFIARLHTPTHTHTHSQTNTDCSTRTAGQGGQCKQKDILCYLTEASYHLLLATSHLPLAACHSRQVASARQAFLLVLAL